MESVNLNLIPQGTNPVVHASQFDEGRSFRFNLFNGVTPFTLSGAETVSCVVKKPDGNLVTVAVTNTSSDYIEVTTTEQMTACYGANLGEIRIAEGSNDIGTLNFTLSVEESPLNNGIESESSIHDLQTQIGEAVADQYDAEDVVFDSVPTTGHGVGFAVTSEGVKNAIDGIVVPDELNDLSDVDISGQALGEALVWDGTKWVNGTVSTVGNLDDLNDVDTTGKANGDSLRYDGAEWVAKPTTVALTQAEYDALQLSGDLVPNTHYVITDAPNLNPTASDIEYTSGVSVADKLTSLASGQTPQAVTGISYNSTNINSGSFTCYKIGRLVMLDIAALQTKIAIGSNEEELLSGLPLPLVDTGRYSLFDGDGTSRARVKVTSDGKLRMWHNPSNFTVGTGFYGNVYYISAT